MRRLTTFFLMFSFSLLFCAQIWAAEWRDSPETAVVFTAAGVEGTFVLHDVKAGTFVGHNRERAETRFVPASTYKIPHTLIGLTTGAVQSVDEVLPYGGKPQPIKVWERDMSLREAIKISNVPVYQELARRIRLERMRAELAKLNYGNGAVGPVVDVFWLEGPLRISAVEQTLFLARLAQKELPFPQEAQAAVREILLVEQAPEWTLFAKTGTAVRIDHPVAWWVGWVEKSGRVYTFALNIDPTALNGTVNRVELGKACLKALGVLVSV